MGEDTDMRNRSRPAGAPTGSATQDTSDGAAITPRDTATGAVRPTDGPMERAGTEAEARARGEEGPFEGLHRR